jgi:hypothetical protein
MKIFQGNRDDYDPYDEGPNPLPYWAKAAFYAWILSALIDFFIFVAAWAGCYFLFTWLGHQAS